MHVSNESTESESDKDIRADMMQEELSGRSSSRGRGRGSSCDQCHGKITSQETMPSHAEGISGGNDEREVNQLAAKDGEQNGIGTTRQLSMVREICQSRASAMKCGTYLCSAKLYYIEDS